MTTTSSEATAVGGHRPTEVKGIKELKLNSEGGTKKEYEDFLKSIERHVGIAWQYGSDIAQAVKLHCKGQKLWVSPDLQLKSGRRGKRRR